MPSSTELLLQIYQELFKQKAVLPNAPAMTIGEAEQTLAKLDKEKATQETAAVVAYLLGQQDVLHADWNHLLQLIKQYYNTQPEWKKILLDYLEYLLELRTEENQEVQKKLIQEINELLEKKKV